MNAGQFSLPDGRTMGARRVVGVSGRDTNLIQATTFVPAIASFAPPAGLSQYFSAMPTATRTRIYSATGRGAIRLMLVEVPQGVDYRIEAFLDGNQIYARTFRNVLSTTQAQVVVGFVTAPPSTSVTNVFPDYLLFDSSFEVYLTITQAGQAASWCYLLEAHQ